MTLVEFLRARLDEDEQVARAAADRTGEQWRASAPGLYNESDPSNHPGPFATGAWGDLEDDVAEHIARHDPARVLAEVAVKRRIVELHLSWAADFTTGPDARYADRYCQTCSDNDMSWWSDKYPPEWPCPTLRLLALPHADRPDYDPAWRP